MTASPSVQQYEKVKNVIEDDPFQVECVAWGTLPLAVTWTLRGAVVNADHQRGVMYKNSSSSGQLLVNATLRIQAMLYADEGDYVCVAHNDYGNATATITVHVKGTTSAVHNTCTLVTVQ